jgi:hypothetical protein
MPTDPSHSPAPDQSPTPEQRERRALIRTRPDRALYRLMIFVSVVTLAAGLIVRSVDANALERALPIVFGFLIVYISLLLALLILIFRNRPSYTTLLRLRNVRIVVIGGFILLCAMIALFLTLFLWSLGIGVSADTVTILMIGFFILVVAFVVMSIVAAFMALIEHGTRQQEQYRANHPRPS